MNRRDFLQRGICSALTLPLVTPTFATAALVQRRTDLIFAAAPGSPGSAHEHMARVFMRTFENLTSRCARFHVASSSAQTCTDVIDGQCDVSLGFVHDAATLHPAFGYFAGLPCKMGLPSDTQAAWIRMGGGQKLWDRLGFEVGIKPLFAGHVGSSAVTLRSLRKINDASSFHKMRLVATGLVRDVVAGLGASPLSSDIDGTVDAVQRCTCDTYCTLGDCQTHDVGGGFLPHGSTLAVSMHRKTWDRLSRHEQAAMQAAAHVAAASFKDCADIQNRTADRTRDICTTYTPQMPVDVTIIANRIAEAVVADIASTDRLSARINDSYLAARSRHQI